MQQKYVAINLAIPGADSTNGAAVDISQFVVGTINIHAFAASLTGTYEIWVAPDGTDNWSKVPSMDITATGTIKAVAASAARLRLRRTTVTVGALDKATLTGVKRVG